MKRVCMTLALGLSCLLMWGSATEARAGRWEPRKTRVFVVSMTRFEGGVGSPWGTRGRLDNDLIRLLEARGVPASQVTFLTDEDARRAHVRDKFIEALKQSSAGETLVFDFSSHGNYDAKTRVFTYSAYDGPMSFEWFFDAIERDFRGAQVIMFADCCYSGGIIEIARRRPASRIAYACLSSTSPERLGYSGWRFFDCLIRGFSGNPVVDLDSDGRIELDEMARFTEKHMAFVADGRPMFYASAGFDPRTVIADARGPRPAAPVGQYVEALHDNKWCKGEITEADGARLRVHFTDERINTQVWLDKREVRFTQAAPAPGWSGEWRGEYENSTGQRGADSLVLREDDQGNLTGTWSGDIPVRGRRDGDTARLTGRTSHRDYTISVTLGAGVLLMRYTGRRLDSGGTYTGKVTLRREK